MSATELLERDIAPEQEEWMVLDESVGLAEAEEYAPLTLAERWEIPDPVADLLNTLIIDGRDAEAEMIANVLENRHAVSVDALFLRAMSESLAEDWDSPEDSYYDTL